MQKIMVIGCCGAGKSTFSKKLSEINGLEIIHLDQYYWQPNWEATNSVEWKNIIAQLSAKSSWIMDGNYGGTMDTRIKQVDTIIFLNYSTAKCLWRITKRIWKYWGTERPDMTNGCKERFDLNFYHYVATYNLKRRKSLLEKLSRYKNEKQILIFQNDKAAAEFLSKINAK